MDIPLLSPQAAEQLLHAYIVAERPCWSVLKASGDKLRDYLQGQITQDIGRLNAEQAIHTCLLTPQGKAVSELYLCQGAGDELVLLAPTHVAEEVVARLRRFSLGYQLRIGIVGDLALFSVQGACADSVLPELDLEEPQDAWLACSRNLAEGLLALRMPRQPHGLWIIGNRAQLAAQLPERVDEEQYEAMRIIRGLPRFGVEWDGSLHPLNANLIEFDGVSFDKGCYVGQEVTSRMHWRGGIKKKLYRVQLPDGCPESMTLPCPVHAGGKIGEIRSLARDQQGQFFGIALLPITVVDAATALHLEDGSAVCVLEACHA